MTNILTPDSSGDGIDSGPESEEPDEEPSAMRFSNAVHLLTLYRITT